VYLQQKNRLYLIDVSLYPEYDSDYWQNWSNRILRLFHHRVAKPFLFLRTEPYGDILTGTPLMGPLNAGGVGRNNDSEPISGFIACCQRCDRPGVINTLLPDRGKL